MHLKAVIFDFDGTLTKEGALDFAEIRKSIHCPADRYILDFIAGLDEKKRHEAEEKLAWFEFKASETSVEEEHASSVIVFLKERQIPVIIITRNSRKSVLRALENFKDIRKEDFHTIISRDDNFPVKPDPSSIVHIAEVLNIKCSEICMIGDYIHDIEAGQKAGTLTIYKKTNRLNDCQINSDYTISSLGELRDIFYNYLPLKMGKFPNPLLVKLLDNIFTKNEKLIIGPEVGEDTAAMEISDDEVLIIKSDPITFTTRNIGKLAVNINLNDMATSGAKARWMTAVLLLPPETFPDEVYKIMSDISTVCREYDICLCGGHTEITNSVIRPIISCTILGTVEREKLINKKSVRPGDSIVITKSAGLEGTAIIASDFYEQLSNGGIDKCILERSKRYIEEISITKEAEVARETGYVTALHDATEGGIATALSELSLVSGSGFTIDMTAIPLRKETRTICSFFDLNPLGLLSSGALIIICRKAGEEIILSELSRKNIPATVIGIVNSEKSGITVSEKELTKWPLFETDEISRII